MNVLMFAYAVSVTERERQSLLCLHNVPLMSHPNALCGLFCSDIAFTCHQFQHFYQDVTQRRGFWGVEPTAPSHLACWFLLSAAGHSFNFEWTCVHDGSTVCLCASVQRHIPEAGHCRAPIDCSMPSSLPLLWSADTSLPPPTHSSPMNTRGTYIHTRKQWKQL